MSQKDKLMQLVSQLTLLQPDLWDLVTRASLQFTKPFDLPSAVSPLLFAGGRAKWLATTHGRVLTDLWDMVGEDFAQDIQARAAGFLDFNDWVDQNGLEKPAVLACGAGTAQGFKPPVRVPRFTKIWPWDFPKRPEPNNTWPMLCDS